jgi:charged multivesicular body protein 6
MGPLFSKKKTIELKAEDQAILKCKMCRDNIKRYIKRLENDANLKKQKAKEALQAKNKDRARLNLRMEKMYREQIKTADGQLEMIETQINQIESAQSQKDVMTVLQEGNAVLKKLQEEVNVDKYKDISDDMEEIKAKNDEITEFFKDRGIDEEVVNDELDKLIASVQQEAGADLPRANEEKLEGEKQKEEKKVKKVAVEA